MAVLDGDTFQGAPYDTVAESRKVFSALLSDAKLNLPHAITSQAAHVQIHGIGGQPTIPTPWRETEAITATKALEACIALAIAELRFPSGNEDPQLQHPSTPTTRLSHSSCPTSAPSTVLENGISVSSLPQTHRHPPGTVEPLPETEREYIRNEAGRAVLSYAREFGCDANLECAGSAGISERE